MTTPVKAAVRKADLERFKLDGGAAALAEGAAQDRSAGTAGRPRYNARPVMAAYGSRSDLISRARMMASGERQLAEYHQRRNRGGEESDFASEAHDRADFLAAVATDLECSVDVTEYARLRDCLERVDKFITAVAPTKLTKEMDSIRNEVRHALAGHAISCPSRDELGEALDKLHTICGDLLFDKPNQFDHDEYERVGKLLHQYRMGPNHE